MNNMYYHNGAANHGCEAIVRSTVKITGEKAVLFTFNPIEDLAYGLDDIAEIIEDNYKPVSKKSLEYIKCAVSHKIHNNDFEFIKAGHKEFLQNVSRGDIYMSIGGDNYCYNGTDILGYYNRMLHEKGAKTVLWGCSVEPESLSPDVVKDLKMYDLITVRESLSYEGLIKAGIADNVVLCADPAFQLDVTDSPLPEGFEPEHTIGINLSPLATGCGSLVVDNYIELVRYILSETSNNVLLIPHVVKPDSDDRTTLQILFDKFADSGRIAMAEDKNCMELKSIISKCKVFVGARTHATIAAYSMCVPTLVAGYSIKARGIAKDIFGTDEHYVVPVQSFSNEHDLTNAYKWIESNADGIKAYLIKRMPEYSAKSYIAAEALKRLYK